MRAGSRGQLFRNGGFRQGFECYETFNTQAKQVGEETRESPVFQGCFGGLGVFTARFPTEGTRDLCGENTSRQD